MRPSHLYKKLALLCSVFLLNLVLIQPASAYIQPYVHYFDCNECHFDGMNYYDVAGTVCLKCHKDGWLGMSLPPNPPTASDPNYPIDGKTNGKFLAGDASNAAGNNPTYKDYETSHNWNAPTDTIPQVGARAPVRNAENRFFYSRYGTSVNKITCSRCHLPHAYTDNPQLLVMGKDSADKMCRACHQSWVLNDRGWLTHPIIEDYSVSVANHPDKYKPTLTNMYNGAIQLVDGGVSCTSCHGVHFTDSDSSTTDGPKEMLNTSVGKILRGDGADRTDKSSLCQTCHTYMEHGDDIGEKVGCLVCHSGHSYDPIAPNYFVLRKSATTTTYNTVNGLDYSSPDIVDPTKADSKYTFWNDGTDGTANGYCEGCHGDAKDISSGSYHAANSVCTDCHSHGAASFVSHGGSGGGPCGQCHGHDAGYEYLYGHFSEGAGTTHSHSTHTENDADDLKGPNIGCDDCHKPDNYPLFADGKDLEETKVCDDCHSKNGSYDGVYSAKDNWQTGIYNSGQLQAGKEMWCVTCHDEVPANSKANGSGITTQNVIGDNSSYGFYISGHGNNTNIGCTACHDIRKRHIDHSYSPVNDVLILGNNPTKYRFYDGAGMILPVAGYSAATYRLCYQCHQEALISTDLPVGANYGTNFREQGGSWGGVNLHRYHVIDGLTTSCLQCHNVHGSQRTRMTDPSPEGNGDFRPLRKGDTSLSEDAAKYYELTDLSQTYNSSVNVGGSIVTNPDCGACHNAVSLGSGLALPNDEGWYLRYYDDQRGTYLQNSDFDGDGLVQEVDNCPVTANSSQDDDDLDGIGNVCDNCPTGYNPDQANTDQDGLGDACDNECKALIPGWGTQFGPGESEATDVAVDGEGNSFVVGNTTSVIEPGYVSQGQPDLFIARYDANGNRVWIRQFGSTGSETAYAVAIDASNNAYVVGRTTGTLDGPINGSGLDAFILKYNADGLLQWVKQLHSSNSETANDVTVDVNGDVYVTGTTGGDLDGEGSEIHRGGDDIFVTSYNSAGVQRWYKQLGTSANDYGSAIAVAPNGDILITGDTSGDDLDGTGQSKGYFAARYSSGGAQIWLHQYGASSGYYARAIGVKDTGEIFIGGDTYDGPGLTRDTFLKKLDPTGALQWSKLSFSITNTYGWDIAVDDSDGVYLVDSDFYLKQYSYDGVLQKNRKLGSTGSVQAIGLDGLGQVYLAGSTGGSLFRISDSTNDAILFRLDQALCPDGADSDADNDGIPNGWDNCPYIPNELQEDNDNDGLGNACDTQCPDDSLNDQDSDGICDSNDYCLNDPINDPDGDGVCASSDNCPLTSNAPADASVDTDGDGWGDACDNSPLVSNPDQKDTDLDGIGDVSDSCSEDPDNDIDDDGICAGTRYLYSVKSGANDNCPLVANPDQLNTDLDNLGDACEQPCSDYTVNWKTQFGTAIRDGVQAMATVVNDGLVIVGKSNGDLNSGGHDFYLKRVEIDGSHRWTQTLGSYNDKVYATAVAVAADGSIYVAGDTQGDIDADGTGNDIDQSYPVGNKKDIFLAKFTPAGGFSWLRQFGTTTDDLVTGIAIDSAGDIYLSGETSGDLDGPGGAELWYGNKDLFLIKYNSDGTRTWLRQHGTTRLESATDIAIYDDSIYLSGYASVSNLDGQAYYGYDDAILLKYDNAGNHQWTRQIGTGSYDKATAVSPDSAGNIYLSGDTLSDLFGLSSGSTDVFLAKFDPAGNQLWGRQLGGKSSEYIHDMAVTNSGVFLTGYTNGDFDDDGPLLEFGSSSPNAILIKFDQSGQHQWSNQYGLTSGIWSRYLAVRAIAAAPDGTLYLGGSSYGLFANSHIGFEDSILMQIEACQTGITAPVFTTTDGVDPDSGAQNTTFTFGVNYSDADNDPPWEDVEVWIDTNDDGNYSAGEKFAMTEVDAADTVYTDGKLYTYSIALSYAGDGILNYRFNATDGRFNATGDPAADNSLEVINAAPGTPAIGSPDGISDVLQPVALTASVFTDIDTGDTHQASQWLISTVSGDYNAANLLYDSGASEASTLHSLLASLPKGTTGYWKVRYQDNHGLWSAYSDEAWFTLIDNAPPGTPINSSPGPDAKYVTTPLILETELFSDADVGDTHAGSIWQVSTRSGANFVKGQIYNSTVPGASTSHDATATLAPNTVYFWRARHQDDKGQWSPFSTDTRFKTTSRVSYWPLDEGSGITANDAVGNNNGTLLNGTSWNDTSAFSGKALDFNGSGILANWQTQGMTWTYPGDEPPANNFTIEAMVKTSVTHQVDAQSNSSTTGTSGQKYLFGAHNRGTNAGAGVSIGTNGISVYEHGASYMPPIAVYSGSIGTGWNHVVVTYTNKQPRIYLNGVLVRTGLPSPRPKVYAPVQLGAGMYGFFGGSADEVAIHNAALTPEEVLQRCIAVGRCTDADLDADGVSDSTDNCPFNANPDQADLDNDGIGNVCESLSYWKFDEGAGSIAQDETIYDNDGQLIGGTTWTTGKVGSAVRFDGADDYINIPDTPLHHFGTGSFTIETWINASSFTSTDAPTIVRWLSKSAWCTDWLTDPSCVWFVGQINSSGQPQFSGRGYGDSSWFGHTAAETISLNTWHHIAYVIDRDTTPAKGYIYIDGVNQSGTGVEFAQLIGELDIPAPITLGGPYADLPGKLDQTVIYDSALSAAEILDHYQNP